MKHFLAAVLILISGIAHAQYVTATETLIPTTGEMWWRFNTYNGHGVIPGAAERDGYPVLQIAPEGTWVYLDLPAWVPFDAVAVKISGYLILTHGNAAQTCNLTFYVEGMEIGEGDPQWDYIGQVVEGHVGGGQRSGFSVIAPVFNGQIGIMWDVLDAYYPSAWPTGCAYGGRFNIDAAYR